MTAASGTITIVVNGEPRMLVTGTTALGLLQDLGLESRPVAVELNELVVPRARLAGCVLGAGDRLEIVTLVGGG
ncbi:MAG: sulfur carrier protein ThiS [Planctomycetaceae bacterium]